MVLVGLLRDLIKATSEVANAPRALSASSGKEVDAEEIKLGYETAKGHYVEFTQNELDELQPASTMNDMRADRDVIVIGGGQAGLAIGYFLAQHGRDFTILEAAHEPAAAWRQRWNSLKLFTSARYDALPGFDFPGDPDRYPTRDEVAAYLTDYANRFALPVELDSRVRAIRKAGASYSIELGDRAYEAEQVVVATGPFQTPFVPPIAEHLGPAV